MQDRRDGGEIKIRVPIKILKYELIISGSLF